MKKGSPVLIGAVEAGGTKFILALAHKDGSIIERTRIETRGGEETLAEMVLWFEAAQGRHGSIGAFGIASFGPIGIDPARSDYGILTNTVKPGWEGVNILAALERFHVPVALDTDVNGAALGEAMSGAGKGRRVIVYTTVGTGIGTGIVKDGRSISGLSHYEIGHLRPPRDHRDNDFAGHCIYHGDCCEGLASGTAIRARWGDDLSVLADPEKTRLVGQYIGHLAATLAISHMPEILIFGGGVMKTPGLIEEVRHSMRTNLAGYLTYYDRDLSEIVVPPDLGDNAGITGAIVMARRLLVNERLKLTRHQHLKLTHPLRSKTPRRTALI